MEKTKSVRTWLLLAGVPLLGCMSLTHYERTEVIRGGEPRQAVAFESPQVAERFTSVVRQRWHDEASRVKTESAGILFLCCYSKSTALAESAFYNDQVRACDLNCDGVITEAEACFYEQHGEALPQISVKRFGPLRMPLTEAPTPPGG